MADVQIIQHKVDIEWYVSNQLLPPIGRLIEPVDGIELDFVAQCLGLDVSKYSKSGLFNRGDENAETDAILNP